MSELKKLLDVCDFQGGTQPPKNEWINSQKTGYIRMIQIRDYSQGDEKFIQYVLDTPQLHKCDKTDIMLSRYGYIGQPFMGLSGAYNVALVKVVKKLPVETLYLFYYFQSAYFQHSLLSNVGARATIPGFNKTELSNTVILIPDHKKQLSIAAQFKQIDKAITNQKKQLEFFDMLVKSQFIELFGNPVTNSKNIIQLTLPELGEFGRGVSKHRPRNAIELLGGQYPLIQTGDVANADLYIKEYTETYSEFGLNQSKMWDKGTLCITIAANIAKTAILNFNACFPDSIVGFNANSLTNNIYIHYWFSFFQEILEKQAPESAQKNINLKVLSELKVIVPIIELQNEFVEFVQVIDKSKFECSISLNLLKSFNIIIIFKHKSSNWQFFIIQNTFALKIF